MPGGPAVQEVTKNWTQLRERTNILIDIRVFWSRKHTCWWWILICVTKGVPGKDCESVITKLLAHQPDNLCVYDLVVKGEEESNSLAKQAPWGLHILAATADRRVLPGFSWVHWTFVGLLRYSHLCYIPECAFIAFLAQLNTFWWIDINVHFSLNSIVKFLNM